MRAELQITRLTALREPRSCDLRSATFGIHIEWLIGHANLIKSELNSRYSLFLIIIYHDLFRTPRRRSHVKSDTSLLKFIPEIDIQLKFIISIYARIIKS